MGLDPAIRRSTVLAETTATDPRVKMLGDGHAAGTGATDQTDPPPDR